MKHANNFNVLRLFAAILVVITHSYAVTGTIKNEPLFGITNGNILCASIGLYIFFFISGFLVTKSAQDSRDIFHFFLKLILCRLLIEVKILKKYKLFMINVSLFKRMLLR